MNRDEQQREAIERVMGEFLGNPRTWTGREAALAQEIIRLRAESAEMEKYADEVYEREESNLHKALDDLGIPSSTYGPGKWYDGSIARIRTALTGSDYSVLGEVESDGVVRIKANSITIGSRVRVVLLRGGESEARSAEMHTAALTAAPPLPAGGVGTDEQ